MPDSLHIICPHCDTTNRVPSDRMRAEPNCGKCKQALFTAHPVELNSKTFQHQIEKSDIPVLVDFWAPWCAPCRAMAPAYSEAARLLEPEIRVAKLNTEDVPDVAARFVIRSIPTLALFRQGREVARQAGAMDASRIVAWARSVA